LKKTCSPPVVCIPTRRKHIVFAQESQSRSCLQINKGKYQGSLTHVHPFTTVNNKKKYRQILPSREGVVWAHIVTSCACVTLQSATSRTAATVLTDFRNFLAPAQTSIYRNSGGRGSSQTQCRKTWSIIDIFLTHFMRGFENG
jgi:hypothetical protein